MFKLLVGLFLLSSVSAFAQSYTCTLNTDEGIEFDETIGEPTRVGEIIGPKVTVAYGDDKEIDLGDGKKLYVSFVDAASLGAQAAQIYPGMNLFLVRFLKGDQQVAYANLIVAKGAKVIAGLAGDEKRLVNVFCQAK